VEKMYTKWQSMDGWKNKVFSLIKGPGWSPGSPWTGHMDQVPDITSREKHSYPTKPLIWSTYIFIHFFITLFVYEAVGLFRDRLSAMEIVCHLVFVVLSLANIGLFYDGNPAAAALEFVRCAFVFFYTQAGIPLLTTALYWSGLTALVGDNLETFFYVLLRSYFFISAAVWALPTVHHAYQRTLHLKMKIA